MHLCNDSPEENFDHEVWSLFPESIINLYKFEVLIFGQFEGFFDIEAAPIDVLHRGEHAFASQHITDFEDKWLFELLVHQLHIRFEGLLLSRNKVLQM